jgi:hypothetical protein
LKHNAQSNTILKVIYLIPKSTLKHPNYAVSMDFFLQCYYRLSSRTDHPTLDNANMIKTSSVLFMFFKFMEKVEYDDNFLAANRLDGFLRAPLAYETATSILPKNVENEILTVLSEFN